MQKLLLITLIGWLAVVGVSANKPKWPWSSDKPESEFHALNKHFKLPSSSSLKSSLEHITSKMGKLPAGAKEQAERFIKLVEQLERVGDECSDETMALLLDLQGAGLKVDGNTKIEKLLSSSWTKALDLCKSRVESSYETSPDSNTKSFFRAFNTYKVYNTNMRDYEDRSHYRLHLGLLEMIEKNPDFQFVIKPHPDTEYFYAIRHDKKKFNEAFEELLVKECKNIQSNDGLVDKMATLQSADFLENIKRGFKDRYKFDFEVQLKNMNWTRDLCSRLINMDEAEKDQVFHAADPDPGLPSASELKAMYGSKPKETPTKPAKKLFDSLDDWLWMLIFASG